MTRLRYPPEAIDGRLVCVGDEPAAVRQLLALAADIEPGEFAAFPSLADPTFEADFDDLGDRVTALFHGIGRPDIKAQFHQDQRGMRLGWVHLAGMDAAGVRWRMRVPLEQRDSGVALNLAGWKEGY